MLFYQTEQRGNFGKITQHTKMLKEMGIILTRSVCTEFSQLPLLVLGDENVTFPQALEDVVHGGSFLLLPGEKEEGTAPFLDWILLGAFSQSM